MTEPAAVDDPYEKANSQVRDAAKWLIASSAAVGAALIAGSQLSSIGKLPVGWPLTLETARLWIAVGGATLGLVAIVYILWTAVKLLPEVQVTLPDLVDAGDDPKSRFAVAIEYFRANPRQMQGATSLKALDEHRAESIAALKPMTDPAEIETQKAYIGDLDARVYRIEERARSKLLFHAFEKALTRLLGGTAVAAVSIIAFAWAANPPDNPPVADLTNAQLTGANLRDADLKNVILDDADLTRADLTGADLTGASLDDVTWSGTTCPDGQVSDSVGGTCAGHLSP